MCKCVCACVDWMNHIQWAQLNIGKITKLFKNIGHFLFAIEIDKKNCVSKHKTLRFIRWRESRNLLPRPLWRSPFEWIYKWIMNVLLIKITNLPRLRRIVSWMRRMHDKIVYMPKISYLSGLKNNIGWTLFWMFCANGLWFVVFFFLRNIWIFR